MRWGLSTLALAASLVHGPSQAADGRLALVIGNSVYSVLPPIPACAVSSSAVSAALKRAGFTVTEWSNASNGRMGAAITDFTDTVARAPGSVALVYVCGYAANLESRLFLLPASAAIERDADLLTQGVIARLVTSVIANADTRAGLVLMDDFARPATTPATTPGSNGALPTELLAGPAMPGARAVAAVQNMAGPSDHATPLAEAVASALAAPSVELRATLAEIRTRVAQSPGAVLGLREPAEPAFLIGGPLHVTPAVAGPATPPPARPAEPESSLQAVTRPAALPLLTPAERRRVQGALLNLGYYGGRVDGFLNPDTIAAIRRYQHEIGSPMTGRLTNEQLERLLGGAN